MPPAMSYVYDSAGRRVSATEGTNQRMFLVTPAMGSGLESTDLMADGAGNLTRTIFMLEAAVHSCG